YLLFLPLGYAASPLEEYGYNSSISFGEAVSGFNKSAAKSIVGRNQPPLTEKELELALYTCSTTVSSLDEKAYDALMDVIKLRALPRGLLIFMCDNIYWKRKEEEPPCWLILVQFGLKSESGKTPLSGLTVPVRVQYEINRQSR